MSQEELGAEVSKTKGAISSYEKGASYPSVEALVAISRLFSVSIDDLLLADLSKDLPSEGGRIHQSTGLNKEEKLELALEMQKNEITLLRKQLEDLHRDKALNQEQIKKL